jgi:hypothetical protein
MLAFLVFLIVSVSVFVALLLVIVMVGPYPSDIHG